MARVRLSAREIAEEMAGRYYAAHGAVDVADEYREPFIAMVTPVAEVVIQLYAEVDDLSARVDLHAEMIAGLWMRSAEARGELDSGWPDVPTTDEVVRDIERRYLSGGGA